MKEWFSHPEHLWWLLLALPILIVHLLKFKPRPLAVPSTRLWREAIEEPVANRFFSPLKRPMELVLQLLTLLALVLALAGAQIPDWGSAPRQMIFALDGRAPMLASADGQSRLALAKRYMRSRAQRAGPTDTFGLLVVGDRLDSIVAPGSSAEALLAALSQLELSPSTSDPDSFERSLLAARKLRSEGEEVLYLTGPLAEDEIVPAGIGVQTFGSAVEDNWGIAALHFREQDDGGLVVSANLSRPKEGKGGNRLLVIEQAVGEQWKLLDSKQASGHVVHFHIPLETITSWQKFRVQFAEHDDFSADDLITFEWQVLANLSLQTQVGALGELIKALTIPGAGEIPHGSLIRVEESPANALVSGVLRRMPSPWWRDVPNSLLRLEEVPILSEYKDFTPALIVDGKPLAGVAKRGSYRDLVISSALLNHPEFQRSNTLLALVGSWYREQQIRALDGKVRGVSGPSVQDHRLSARVRFTHSEEIEATPMEGDVSRLYAYSLELWLWLLGLLLLLFEWIRYLRSRQGDQIN